MLFSLKISLLHQYHTVDELLKTEHMLPKAINTEPVTSLPQKPTLRAQSLPFSQQFSVMGVVYIAEAASV